jgi:hypothetical protein
LDKFFSEYFGFSLSVSFHRCSITLKNEKKKLIIFITGLHIKPLGCGASVASAAGPFTNNKPRGIGGRNRGRPKLGWCDELEEDVARVGCRNWRLSAQSREEWRKLIKGVTPHPGI